MDRKTSVTYCTGRDKEMPMIRLRGRWLTAAGFAPGALVRVGVRRGRLVLELASHREADSLVCEPEPSQEGENQGGTP